MCENRSSLHLKSCIVTFSMYWIKWSTNFVDPSCILHTTSTVFVVMSQLSIYCSFLHNLTVGRCRPRTQNLSLTSGCMALNTGASIRVIWLWGRKEKKKMSAVSSSQRWAHFPALSYGIDLWERTYWMKTMRPIIHHGEGLLTCQFMRVLQDSDTHESVLINSNHALLHNTASILEYNQYNIYIILL